MAIFGLELRSSKSLVAFVDKTNIRLQENHLVRNPFYGQAKIYDGFIVVDLVPVYMNPGLLGLFMFIAPLVISTFKISLWLLPGFLLMLSSIFWSKYFFVLMFILGLRKEGYKGKVKLIKDQETLRRLLKWAN